MIKHELTQIIIELKDTIDSLGMKISEEVLFSEASSFLRGIYAGRNKSSYKTPQGQQDINKNREGAQSHKPTEKQIELLKKNNREIPETKKEAFEMIQKMILESKQNAQQNK